MKNNFLHSVFSILISFIIVLPFAIETLHALEGHEHTVCTAKNEHHFHQQDVNCSIYHQIIEYNTIVFLVDFDLEIPKIFKRNNTYTYQSKYTSTLQLKLSRGPPYFIV